jgi:hypothetical protein
MKKETPDQVNLINLYGNYKYPFVGFEILLIDIGSFSRSLFGIGYFGGLEKKFAINIFYFEFIWEIK